MKVYLVKFNADIAPVRFKGEGLEVTDHLAYIFDDRGRKKVVLSNFRSIEETNA